MTDVCTTNQRLVGFLLTFFRHSSVMILELSMMSGKGVKKRVKQDGTFHTNMLPQNFFYQQPAKSTFFFISIKTLFPSSLNYKVSYKLLYLFLEI